MRISDWSSDVCSSDLAQIFDFEQNPPSVKWQQINTPEFRLIYPTSLLKEAQSIANLLDTSVNSISRSLRTKPRKIPIILQNHSVESNGFVHLATWRSEFLTTPPHQSDPFNWLRSEARRVGKECVRTCRCRCSGCP